jgi:hypothetical protein
MKHCNKCNTDKPEQDFSKDKNKKDGLSTVCTKCRRRADIERSKLPHRIAQRKSKRLKDWYSEYNKRPERREKARNYQNNVWRVNEQNKRACNFRNLIRICIRRNSNTQTFNDITGCSLAEFKKHIESLFTADMTWENYAKVWEFDHIKPLSMFDLTNENEVLIGCNYSNIQPLHCVKNKEKSNKILITE